MSDSESDSGRTVPFVDSPGAAAAVADSESESDSLGFGDMQSDAVKG